MGPAEGDEMSPRQELREYVNEGNLRRDLERCSSLSGEAVDLVVRLAINYTEKRRPIRASTKRTTS